MKFIFAAEDTVVGLVCGALLLGYVGNYFDLKLPHAAYVIAFAVYALVLILDIINELGDLGASPAWAAFSLTHTLLDMIVCITAIAYFGGFQIPYVFDYLVPLVSTTSIFWAAMYIIIGNIVWLALYPVIND